MGYSQLKVNTYPTIFSTCFEANKEIKDGLNEDLNFEIDERIINTGNKTDEGANSELSQAAGLYLKHNKRLCTEKLPKLKHFKPNDHQFGNCVNNHQTKENHSLRNNDSRQYQCDDSRETVFDTSTKHSAGEGNTYFSFCFFLSFALWMFCLIFPNLCRNTEFSSRMMVENEVENPVATEQNISQPIRSEVVAEKEALQSPTTSVIPQAESPNTPRRCQLLRHDHHYETTPRSLKKRYQIYTQKIKAFRANSKVQNQRIGRLKKQISDLTEIVSELRRTRAISEDGLACLQSIAESDVS